MSKITGINAKEILDSRGIPTIEVELSMKDKKVYASVPSGTSSGIYEALELRDGDSKRYNGKGVLKAIKNIKKIIAPALISKNPEKQKEIDEIMIKLDGTENKSKLGANAILAVSIAVCRAGAVSKNLPLYKYISKLSKNKPKMPVPLILMLEGGKHANNSSDLQEFMIAPCKAKSFREAIKIGEEIYFNVRNIVKNQEIGMEGAFKAEVNSNKEVFEILAKAIQAKEVKIAIDSAASEFYKNNLYNLKTDKKILTSQELEFYYLKLIKDYKLFSIEDCFEQDDFSAWRNFNKKIGNKLQIVGDDLLVTNKKRINLAIKNKLCNAMILKINQIGTISEAIEAGNLAKKAGWNIIVSHRSGETEDDFIADLAVGLGAEEVKIGAPSKKERLAKYKRLLEIEESSKIKYLGI